MILEDSNHSVQRIVAKMDKDCEQLESLINLKIDFLHSHFDMSSEVSKEQDESFQKGNRNLVPNKIGKNMFDLS